MQNFVSGQSDGRKLCVDFQFSGCSFPINRCSSRKEFLRQRDGCAPKLEAQAHLTFVDRCSVRLQILQVVVGCASGNRETLSRLVTLC